MNHSDVRNKMADYLEGHLGLTDRALLDAHLDGCPECAGEVGEMRATIAALRSLPEPEVPGDFTANVMRRVRLGEAEPGLFDRIASFFESLASPRILVPVSAAAFSVGLVLWGQQTGVLNTPGGIGRGAAPLPVDGSTVQATEPRQAPAGPSSPNPIQLAGVGATSAAPPPSSSPTTNQAPVAARVGAPQTFNLQIVLSEAPRPPYEFEGSPGISVPTPLRMDRPNARGYRSVDGSPGQSLAVASTGLDASGRDSAMLGPMSTVDRAYGIRADGTGDEPRSRDDWLSILEANPSEFAARLSQLTLAEQELWVDRLARHAAEQGALDRVIERLAAAGGQQGERLAADFAAVGARTMESSAGDPARP